MIEVDEFCPQANDIQCLTKMAREKEQKQRVSDPFIGIVNIGLIVEQVRVKR